MIKKESQNRTMQKADKSLFICKVCIYRKHMRKESRGRWNASEEDHGTIFKGLCLFNISISEHVTIWAICITQMKRRRVFWGTWTSIRGKKQRSKEGGKTEKRERRQEKNHRVPSPPAAVATKSLPVVSGCDPYLRRMQPEETLGSGFPTTVRCTAIFKLEPSGLA